MDPNAAWKELSETYDDPAEVGRHYELARGLLDWLDRGGFPPTITGRQPFDRDVAFRTCLAIVERGNPA